MEQRPDDAGRCADQLGLSTRIRRQESNLRFVDRAPDVDVFRSAKRRFMRILPKCSILRESGKRDFAIGRLFVRRPNRMTRVRDYVRFCQIAPSPVNLDLF